MIARNTDSFVRIRTSHLEAQKIYCDMLVEQNKLLVASMQGARRRLLRHQAFIAIMLCTMFTCLVYLITMEVLSWAA